MTKRQILALAAWVVAVNSASAYSLWRLDGEVPWVLVVCGVGVPLATSVWVWRRRNWPT